MKRSRQDKQDSGRESDNRDTKKIVLGRISGVHGVSGWLKIFSYTDPMESIVGYNPWYIRRESSSAPWIKVVLEAGRRHAKTVIAKLEHCNDRDEAQDYVGSEIAIEAAQLEQDRGKDEYYWYELIGLRVINRQGVELGVVKNLMETGANDVLVVTTEKDGHDGDERLIPWAMHQTVVNVDLQQGMLEVDWDEDF